MTRISLTASIATLALVAAAPALAKPGGGGEGARGGTAARADDAGVAVRDVARAASQAQERAADRAIERANDNSVLRQGVDSEPITGTRIPSSRANTDANAKAKASVSANANASLTGVTTGMSVVDVNGVEVGTVTGVRAVGSGNIKAVQVTLADGSIILLSPSSVSLDGDVLTTTSLTSDVKLPNASVNGLVHANPRSALGLAGVTTLTGLTTGLTVNTSGGELVGTVSEVFVNRACAVVAINVALEGGGTATLLATGLRMDGTTVVTTAAPGG